jgi:ubiquitin carboxyl-terminal hydrolase 9/24
MGSSFMTTNALRDWMVENKVLEVCLGENSHVEIIKRTAPLIKFMIKYGNGAFDASSVDLIWKAQLGKHEDIVRNVYNLI